MSDPTGLLSLPDELLLQIILELPPTPVALRGPSLTCRRLHAATISPIAWARVFYAVPGFRLRPEFERRVVATTEAPGQWEGREWVPGHAAPARAMSWTDWLARFPRLVLPARLVALLTGEAISGDVPTETLVTTSASTPADAPIPVHYPTLYRARLLAGEEMRGLGPHARFPYAGVEDEPPNEEDVPVSPNHVWTFDARGGYVYSVVLRSPWAITGSRDRSFRIWCMPPLGAVESDYGPILAYTQEAAHEGSVLSVDFERTGNKGFLVTGSSDMTASYWALDFGTGGQDARGDVSGVSARKVATLRGHTGRVAAVALTQRFIVTGSHDNTIRIYDRSSVVDDAAPLHVLHTHVEPLSAIRLDPSGAERIVTAAIDGKWAIIDLATGAEVAGRGGGPKYTCVDWAGDTVACGTVDGQVLLYSASDASVRLAIPGELRRPVRAVLFDAEAGSILSAGHDQRAHFWDLDGRRQRTYDFQAHTVYAMSRDGLRLACAAGTSVWFITYGAGLPYAGLFA